MSRIKELLKEKDTILVFDVDGVLALLEFGDYRHYEMLDDEWIEATERGENYYTEDKVSKRMQKFIKTRNMDNVYVISTVYNDNETKTKELFLTSYYNIKKENIYCVFQNSEKVNVLKKIKENYPDLEDYKICMIDDTVNILNDVMEKTNFSTAHISSFLDI